MGEDIDNEFRIEEYKQIFNLVVDIERRLLQVFSGTVSIGVTLLTAMSGFLLSGNRRTLSVLEAYFMLFPLLLLIPSFFIALGLRMDIARFAGYILVFHEDARRWPRWASSLKQFRISRLFESNDPVPFTYWGLTAAFLILFCSALNEAGAALQKHLWIVFPIFLVLGRLHRTWNSALYEYYQACIESWQAIHSADLGVIDSRNRIASDMDRDRRN